MYFCHDIKKLLGVHIILKPSVFAIVDQIKLSIDTEFNAFEQFYIVKIPSNDLIIVPYQKTVLDSLTEINN